MFRNLFPSILVLTLVVGVAAVWLQSPRNTPGNSDIAEIGNLLEVTDVQATDSDAPEVMEMTLGDDNAPVTIIEYASFTCPHCANYHNSVFGDLKTDYVDTGKVKFIIRDVYFDRLGLWASMLARCDSGQKYFGISDLIYKRQREWTKGESNAEIVGNLKKLGRLAGMNDEVMDACLQDQTMAQALVATYQENASRDEITSTPSFVINGKKEGNMSLADFKTLIDGYLAE